MAELDELRIADKKHIGLAEMLKGGVIMDVTTAEQAKIAEDAGATSVMALERVPADIRRDGGVARMASVKKIKEIQKAVSIPVMAKARIGHFVEARILEALAVDFIDESEVLTPADEHFHIDKFAFRVPFVCGARDLGEALRRIGEGAAMIRTKGEAGPGHNVGAVRHTRGLPPGIRRPPTPSPPGPLTAAHTPRPPPQPGGGSTSRSGRRGESVNEKILRIGVLALQGDFALHARALARCGSASRDRSTGEASPSSIGVEAVEIRKPDALEDVAGLIIPG